MSGGHQNMGGTMAALTQAKQKNILTEGLKLREPRFVLRKYGPRLYGNVISKSFWRKGDFDRQEMIRATLEKALGARFHQKVGMLLAYTPDESAIDEEEKPARLRTKAS